jgi:hypothetical protein
MAIDTGKTKDKPKPMGAGMSRGMPTRNAMPMGRIGGMPPMNMNRPQFGMPTMPHPLPPQAQAPVMNPNMQGGPLPPPAMGMDTAPSPQVLRQVNMSGMPAPGGFGQPRNTGVTGGMLPGHSIFNRYMGM